MGCRLAVPLLLAVGCGDLPSEKEPRAGATQPAADSTRLGDVLIRGARLTVGGTRRPMVKAGETTIA